MPDNFLDYKVVQPAGVNFSIEESQLPNNKWDNANEIAFRHGVTKKVSGYEQGFGTALTTPEVILPLRDDSQKYYWWSYAGKDYSLNKDKVYRILSEIKHDEVTPNKLWHEEELGWDIEYTWTGDSLNGVPYMTKGVPYRWGAVPSNANPESEEVSEFVDLYNFPTRGKISGTGEDRDYERIPRVQFETVRTYRNYMIGLNFHTDDYDAGSDYGPTRKKNPEGKWEWDWAGYDDNSTKKNYGSGWGSWNEGTHQNAVWWLHFAVDKDIDVAWNDADPTKNSGWNFLGGSGGPIVDGKSLRDTFFIYRERSVWQMQYVGGINVFSFKESFDDAGVLGLDCVAEVEGWHYVVGQSDVYRHNGVQKQSIADGIVRKEIFKTIHPNYTDNVFITTKYDDKEIWICVPDSVTTNTTAGDPDEGACNVAFVYNWVEEHWSRKSLPNIRSAAYTILSIPENDISWEAASEGGPLDSEGLGHYVEGGTWEEANDTWLDSFFQYNPSQWGQVLGSTTTKDNNYTIYTTIPQNMYDGSNFDAYVEKRWIELDDKKTTKMVTRVYPGVRNGKVKVYMAGTHSMAEGLNWKYIGEFDPSKHMHIACRVTGRYIHIRFEIPKESRAEINGYWMDWTPVGRR